MTKGRVGIIYFGISYSAGDIGAIRKINRIHTDYRNTIENHRTTILDYFKNCKVDIFLATNKSKIDAELRRDFKPVSVVYPDSSPDNLISRNNKVKSGIHSLLDYAKQNQIIYDYVVITRFDIYFIDNWKIANIDLDKFNIVSRLERPEWICDNLYIFPYCYLVGFLKIISGKGGKFSHYILPQIEKLGKINFIKNEHCNIANLTFYELNRVRPSIGVSTRLSLEAKLARKRSMTNMVAARPSRSVVISKNNNRRQLPYQKTKLKSRDRMISLQETIPQKHLQNPLQVSKKLGSRSVLVGSRSRNLAKKINSIGYRPPQKKFRNI